MTVLGSREGESEGELVFSWAAMRLCLEEMYSFLQHTDDKRTCAYGEQGQGNADTAIWFCELLKKSN